MQHLHHLRRERELEKSLADAPRRLLWAEIQELGSTERRERQRSPSAARRASSAEGYAVGRATTFAAEYSFGQGSVDLGKVEFPSLSASLLAAFSFK